MGSRHLSKALVTLAIAGVAVGLLGLPAAANKRFATINGGSLVLYDSANGIVDNVSLGGGITCDPNIQSFMEMTSNGAPPTVGNWEMAVLWDFADNIAGTNFRIRMDARELGPYAGVGLASTTGDFVNVFRRTTGVGSCTYTPGTGNCTVTATAISVTGTHTVAATPTINVNDTMTVSGHNGSGGDLGFEVSVTGTAADCGPLVALDDGAVEYTNLTLKAV
jgi:hypothetical protein